MDNIYQNNDDYIAKNFKYNSETGEIFRLNRWGKWFACSSKLNGYIKSDIYINNKANTVLVHKIAYRLYYGNWCDENIDHKDGNRSNNKISNLRKATFSQNNLNAKGTGRSKYRGITVRDKNKSGNVKDIIKYSVNVVRVFESQENAIKAKNAWNEKLFPNKDIIEYLEVSDQLKSYINNNFSVNFETGDLWHKNKIVSTKANRYLIISFPISGSWKIYHAHRIIYFMKHGKIPTIIDHINRNSEDNRIYNLRESNSFQNGNNVESKSGISKIQKYKDKWKLTISAPDQVNEIIAAKIFDWIRWEEYETDREFIKFNFPIEQNEYIQNQIWLRSG